MVGKWEGSGQCTMEGADKPVTWKGVSTIGWETDGWVLLERMEGDMDGQKMHALALWSWDPDKKVFNQFWTDNFGGMGHGTAEYDSASQSWKTKGRGKGMMGDTVGEGTMKKVGNDKMEWTYSEWNSWKTAKLFDMTGTSTRVR
jgi:hypothetical protein